MNESVTPATSTCIPTVAELGFAPETLRAQYAAKRAKRLRMDGNNQYQEITGHYAHCNVDTYVAPEFTRPTLNEELDWREQGDLAGLIVQ